MGTDALQAPFHGPAGTSLLVVDDDAFIARLLEIELAAAGYAVRVANDGQQALELVKEDPPDLVITDVMMPHVDGFELTRLLRQDPRTAVIARRGTTGWLLRVKAKPGQAVEKGQVLVEFEVS